MFLDTILSDINKPLTFKIVAFFILSLPTFQSSSQLQNILFALFIPTFKCQFNSTAKFVISKDQCSIFVNGSKIKCQKWNFSSSPVGSTLASDFGLVCDYKYLGDVTLIVWYATFLLGPLAGFLSDRFGRKKIVIFSLILETFSTIIISLAPNFITYLVFRICLGLSASAVYISIVWLIESVSIEFRPFIGSFFWFYWTIAYMVFPLTSFLTRDWRLSQLFSLIPSVFYLLIFFMPESPRWLCVMSRKNEMMESLKFMSKINRLQFDLDPDEIYVENLTEEGNICVALKDSDFQSRSLMALFCAFSINLIYSSMIVDINILSSNMYLSVFLLGLMELPSLLLSFFVLRNIKRKLGFFIIGGSGSILLFISIFFSKSNPIQSIIRIILGCISKIAISSCNQNIMVYVNELFPTTHRSFGITLLLISNFLSFSGAVLINRLSIIYYFLPMSIYCLFLWTIGVFVYFCLPETKDFPIPETLTDMKMLKRGKEEEFVYYMQNKHEFFNQPPDSSDEKSSVNFNEKSKLIIEKNK